jgi:RNA polymerase-binding transcription factor DksA
MTEAERDGFRQQLLELGKHFKGKVSDLEKEALRNTGGDASGNLSNTPVHLADLGSETFEQEINLSLLENEDQRLEEIAAALQRLDEGTYGRCENCRKEISKERLRAVPYTRFCVACARESQEGASPGNL